MEIERALIDLARVRKAIRKLMEAAKVESLAFDAAAEWLKTEQLKALHLAHLDELDAVQALVASLELFERRLPTIEEALRRTQVLLPPAAPLRT